MFGHCQNLSTKMEKKGSLTDFECGMDSRIEHRVMKLRSSLTGFLCTQMASSRQTEHVWGVEVWEIGIMDVQLTSLQLLCDVIMSKSHQHLVECVLGRIKAVLKAVSVATQVSSECRKEKWPDISAWISHLHVKLASIRPHRHHSSHYRSLMESNRVILVALFNTYKDGSI